MFAREKRVLKQFMWNIIAVVSNLASPESNLRISGNDHVTGRGYLRQHESNIVEIVQL